MDATRSVNLGLSIEQRTRAKVVKAERDALDRFKGYGGRDAAIATINGRRTVARLRAVGYEGDTKVMLEAASTLQRDGAEHDAAWHKAMHDVEKHRAALQRSLLRLEAVGAMQYGAGWVDTCGEDENEEE